MPHTDPHTPPARAAAFTLIELLMVLAILGILLGLGIPQLLNYRAELQLRDALNTVAQEFTVANSQSLSRNVPHLLTFTVGSAGKGEMTLHPVANPTLSQQTTLDSGAFIASVDSGGTPLNPAQVVIDGRGRPQLLTPLDVTVQLGVRTGQVRLLPSGKVVRL